MHASQDSDTPTTQIPQAQEFFGGIDPERTAGITPELEDPDRVVHMDPAPHDDDDDSFFTSVVPGKDDDPTESDDAVVPIPEGRYHLERGALVVPLVQIDDGTWQDTFMLKTLQSVGVKHRVGLRAPMLGFCFTGKWTIVEALEQALLVRVDDLIPFADPRD